MKVLVKFFALVVAAMILTAAVPSEAGGGRHHHHGGGGGRHYGGGHHHGHWHWWGPSYVYVPYPYVPYYYVGPPRETVVIVPAPSVIISQPQQSMGQPTFSADCMGPWCNKNQPAPQMANQQGSGPQLVTPTPQPRLRQVNVDTATLMKKAKVQHHTYGKPAYPSDLRPGEAVVICNAASGPYVLESESKYKGHSYHKQQCWRYDHLLDGPPVEEEVFVK